MKQPGGTINLKTFKKLREFLPEDITYDEWKKIISEGNKLVRKEITVNPLGFHFPLCKRRGLPSTMGRIQIARNKPKEKMIDPVATKQTGVTCYYRNYHSFGFTHKIKWAGAKLKFHLYKFVPCRQLKLDTRDSIRAGKTAYLTVTQKELYSRR